MATSGQNKTIEQIYQKKTPIEHILVRPDTYIGSVEPTRENLWVLTNDELAFEEREIEIVPGLYKIFDEILVNAADNYQRDTSLSEIRVIIDQDKNFISIWNNGKGIPVQIHQEYKVYVPDLIFGQLLTGANFDDNEKKVVGGRNGYGAKLTNIFSIQFQVECNDAKNKRYIKIVWKNNMSEKLEPELKQAKEDYDFTCVSFVPDLKKFGIMGGLASHPDIVSLLKKRVYDLAGILTKVKVKLNNKVIKINSFKQYVDMYLPNIADELKIYDKHMTSDRWEVLVSFTDGQFKQVSFVNGICTSRGGSHVNYIADQIVDKIQEQLQKRHKKIQVKNHQIKQNLYIFVNSLVENPAFDSQTKETLTTKPSGFGSKCELSEKFIQAILKTGIIDSIVEQAKARENNILTKAMKGSKKARILGIPKLEDANDAGTKKSEECTLILTEGDSAKALAMAGIEIVGRDKYGVFPLRGKLLNVREATVKQIMENQEIQHLIKIVGLDAKKNYEDVKELRYGSIMIMADQDTDGSHIKGLIINFIHNFWPSLFKMKGFLKEFITPIIKASRTQESFSFFTVQDFKIWCQTHNPRNYKIKYYKGLGTSTDEEGYAYFSHIIQHQIQFQYQNEEDDQAIDLCFNKKKADDRKRWLAEKYDPDIFVDHNFKELRYTDFVNKEMIHFSIEDNLRSIPCLCDGFKPGQRKILFACFKRNLRSELKVAQLSGYVAEHSAYHHGEQSLATTIIGMAQNFVGSNNINLLMPIGQFGTRNLGGKEHASPRYLHTNLSKASRYIFIEHDDHTLKFLQDDNQFVEPQWYLPIIPMVLINGAEGIGTGWSTNVPCYNPKDIIDNLKNRLAGEPFKNMKPWYKGFTGLIELDTTKPNNYICKGSFALSEEDDKFIEITELPIQKWTKDYKLMLDKMMTPEKGEAEIDDIREYHGQNKVDFKIWCTSQLPETQAKIEAKFKLEGSISTNNIVLFDSRMKLKRYNNVMEIMEEFYVLRLQQYQLRKEYLISRLVRELQILTNKTRFILAIIKDELNMKGIKKQQLCETLQRMGFDPMCKIQKIKSTKLQVFGSTNKNENQDEPEEPATSIQVQPNRQQNDDDDAVDDDVAENEFNQHLKEQMVAVTPAQYNYLLSMPIWSLTFEKVEQLQQEQNTKQKELDDLRAKRIEAIWLEELDQLEKVLEEVWELEEKQRINMPKGKVDKGKKVRQRKKAQKQADHKDGDNSVATKEGNTQGTDGDSRGKPKQRKDKDNSQKKPRKVREHKEKVESVGEVQSLNEEKPKEKPLYDMSLEERLQLRQKMMDQQGELANKVSIDEEMRELKEKEWNEKQKETESEMKQKKKARNPLTIDSDEENSFKIDDIMDNYVFHQRSNIPSKQESQSQLVSVGENSRATKESNDQVQPPKTRKIKKVIDEDSEKDSLDDFIADSDDEDEEESEQSGDEDYNGDEDQ